MSIALPSALPVPELPEVFAAGTLLIDGQSVAVSQPVTVRQLVAQRPQRARIFEKYGISYCCCSGNQTFLEACAEKQIDPRLVLADLRECDANSHQRGAEENWDWLRKSADELRTQIVEMHEIFLSAELPRLSYLIERVTARHGVFYTELWELQNLYEEFKSELQAYLQTEAKYFFNLLDSLGSMNGSELQIVANNEIRAIEAKHVFFAQMIAPIDAIGNGFRVPETACNTLRVTLDSLSELTQSVSLYMRIKVAYCCHLCPVN